MNILLGVSRNLRYALVEAGGKNTLEPEIEAVLTTYEQREEFIGADVVKVARTNMMRFTMTPDAARKFAANLVDWADEAERHAVEVSSNK